MADSFDQKSQLIQLLLDMLSKSASTEVDSHLHPSMPSDPAAPNAEGSIDEENMESPMEAKMEGDVKPDISDAAMHMDKMAQGGMGSMPGTQDETVEQEDEDNNSSGPFSFKKRKK